MALQGGTFITNILVANILGASVFGKFVLLINTGQTIASLLQMSTGIASTKYIAQFRESDPLRAYSALVFCRYVSIGFGILGVIVLLSTSRYISVSIFKDENLVHEVVWIGLFAFFSIYSAFQMGVIAGFDNFKKGAQRLSIGILIQIPLTAIAAQYFGLRGAIFGMCLALFVRVAVSAVLVHREERKLRGDTVSGFRFANLHKEMFLGFMLPGALSGITTMPAMWLVSVSLSKLDGGFKEVALLNAALSIRSIFRILPTIFGNVSLSMFSQYLSKKEETGTVQLLKINLLATTVSFLFGLVVVLFFGGYILNFYGAHFENAKPLLEILLFSLAGEIFALPFYQLLSSNGKMWEGFLFTLFPRDLLFLGLSLFLLNDYAAYGIAWAHAFAYIVSFIITVILTKKIIFPKQSF